MKTINLNDIVKVKLNSKGLHTYALYMEEANECMPDNLKFKLAPIIDKDGYSTFQLWDFMKIFGHTMDLAEEPCIDTTIIIE